MTKIMKQSIAVLVVIALIILLFPIGVITGFANNAASIDDGSPVLNETIVDTVTFQSFNFLGNNTTGEDATEYHTTFYYTDDYFSKSAINKSADSQVMEWSDLEDTAMATCSMDFTLASMTSSEGNVVTASSSSWNNTDYSNKDKNVKDFLGKCGFTDIESYGLTEKPTMESIGYTIASKNIHVWDQEAGENKDYTVVAVGIRGAGYDSEWADNVKIGTQGNGASVVRHEGFDNSAKTVCSSIKEYINRKHIDSDVKYWVTGFSRAAAVANLTAGYLTDGENIYHAAQKDIYGYTWECPQAASTNENALNYKNIHNIINPLDAVPKVSPSGFQHQRLGVDYRMPYYKTTSASQNKQYYERMYEVLKTVAVGSKNGERDPLLDAIGNYPYNTTLPIYTLTAGQLISDAISGNLTTNFGTELASTGWIGNVNSILGNNRWYMDDFIDNLIGVFLTSTAWDRGATATTNVITHRTRFINNYQESFRTALGYMLDFSGPAFLGLVDKLLSAVGASIGISTAGMGLAFLNFYNDPTGSYGRFNVLVSSDWRGKPHKDVLISEAKGVVKDVVTNMTTGYTHPYISRTQLNSALDKITEVVIDLYADELAKYESQYFGTTLHWLNTILSTHEQETVLSWIMSLDSNHINRSYRTLTVPKNTTVELHQFREELGETLSTTGESPVVAVFENGIQTSSKDQRIYSEISGNNVIIRYPSSLDIRADIKSNEDVADLEFKVDDYRTNSETIDVSTGLSQFKRLSSEVYTNITSDTGARTINSYSNNYRVPMSEKDVLHIITAGTSSYNDTSARYEVDKSIYVNVIVEGQLIDDSGETIFQPIITNDSGETVTPEFNCTSTKHLDPVVLDDDVDAHLGRNFIITVPEVNNGHYVEQYFVTDSSEDNNRRLSTDDAPYETNYEQSGPYTQLKYGQETDIKDILEREDCVFHVIYSGAPAKLDAVTKIIDFNGKMILATDAEIPEVLSAQNGTFAWDSANKDATYQLDTQKLSDKIVTLTSVYESADEAVIKGIFDNESSPVKKKVTVVPANNIYFNDGLMDKAIRTGDGTGYNEDAGTKYQANRTPVDTDDAGVSYYFTFTGTGIDIYCTTDSEDGYISAAIFQGEKEDVSSATRIGSAKTIKNASSVPYVSTPTLRFHPATGYGTYTVKINAMKGSSYKLDGVRVYGASENDNMDSEQYGNEKNASFVNLREALINNSEDFTFTTGLSTEENPDGVSPYEVSGILFIDNASALPALSINNEALYTTAFAAYKANGPKSEIFLEENEEILFCFENYLNLIKDHPDMKLMVGLRLPGSDTTEATVMLGDKVQKITSHLDMYYEVKPDENGIVTITNQSGDMISLTNLKISGTERVLSFDTNSLAQSVSSVPEAETLLLSVGPKTLMMAAKRMSSVTEDPVITETPEESAKPEGSEEPQTTEEPDDGTLIIDEPEESETPTPSVTPDTPTETGNTIQKVIQSITKSISSFFKSLFRR